MMKKIISAISAISLGLSLVLPSLALATVNVTAGPSSVVTDPKLVRASSAPVALFEFTASNDAGETLSSVSVMGAQNAATPVSGGDLANVAVYKDDGNGLFDSGVDALVGSQTTVNVGSNTIVTPATTTAFSGKFFVSLQTGASWSDAASGSADSIMATLPSSGIATNATSTPTTTAVSTASITADTTAPLLTSAVAKNTGGTSAKEAGDSVELTFSEETNKPAIPSSTIGSYLSVSGGPSFLDTLGGLGAASWNTAGTVLTLTLSGTSTPTSTLSSIVVGDVVTVASSSAFTDLAGHQVSGTQTLPGDFGGILGDDGEEVRGNCANGIINGRLYKVGSEATVYLAAACRLKPFRGAAVFVARGQKFQNIIVLSSLPDNVSISQKPVLPVAGTLVKGKDKTVWFVDSHCKRRGFVSGRHFSELGFSFGRVQVIADTDLALIPPANPIEDSEDHPDGAIIKCGNTAVVFQVLGNAT